MRYGRGIRAGLSVLLLGTISFFFYREFSAHWDLVQASGMHVRPAYVVLSIAAMAITYLINTYSWFFALTSLSGGALTFMESVALFNASNLTKYVPGRVWSFALQMYWLEDAGFPKSLVLFVNLVTLYISLIVSLVAGLIYALISSSLFPASFAWLALGGMVLAETGLIVHGARFTRGLFSVLGRITKHRIEYIAISPKLLLRLHFIYLVAAVAFGLGAYLMCYGVGFDLPARDLVSVMASMIISEVAGVVAVVSPGGLGVREGVMYLQLKGVVVAGLALVLPLATRLASMVVEVTLGLIGLLLIGAKNRQGVYPRC